MKKLIFNLVIVSCFFSSFNELAKANPSFDFSELANNRYVNGQDIIDGLLAIVGNERIDGTYGGGFFGLGSKSCFVEFKQSSTSLKIIMQFEDLPTRRVEILNSDDYQIQASYKQSGIDSLDVYYSILSSSDIPLFAFTSRDRLFSGLQTAFYPLSDNDEEYGCISN